MAHQGVAPVLFESVSNVTATNSVDLGTRREVNGELYVYVYNGGTTQISTGKAAVVAVTNTSGYTVTVSCVSGELPMGVCKHATLTTATYGWLLTRGFVDSLINKAASTAIVVRDNLGVDVNGDFAAAISPVVGKALTATGSAGTFNGYIAIYS